MCVARCLLLSVFVDFRLLFVVCCVFIAGLSVLFVCCLLCGCRVLLLLVVSSFRSVG